MILTFTVTMKQPSRASITDCRDYIAEAVETWCGQCRPPGALDDNDDGDPMWALDSRTVKVKLFAKTPNGAESKK